MVVDASMAIAWILPDERDMGTDRVLHGLAGKTALVPSIFWHELRNAFLMAERRGRLMPGEARSSMAEVRLLALLDAGAGDDQIVMALAIKHSLSAYDAAYLAIAVSRALPLATADRRLAAAARSENVPLLGPLTS